MANIGDINLDVGGTRPSNLDFDFGDGGGGGGTSGFSRNKIGGLVAGIAGLLSANSSFRASQATATQLESNARTNIAGLQVQRGLVKEGTREAATARRKEGKAVAGEQRTQIAASGVTTEGSPTDVLNEAEIATANEVAAIKYSGQLKDIELALAQQTEFADASFKADAIRGAGKTNLLAGAVQAYATFRLGAG